MKKTLFLLAASMLVLFAAFRSDAFAYSAKAYCVMDRDTKTVLAGENIHARMGMASTTKIMTALCVLKNCDPNDLATVSANASMQEGSSLYLKAGEQMRVEDLLYGLMLNSGNDAAVVLAEHTAGNTENFAVLMNSLAKDMGLSDTNFVNPNGLYDDNHYTTAYDLAYISSAAMENEVFRKIVSTKTKTVETADTKRKIHLSNHNRLLRELDGCNGVKTGFTKKTGRTLVSSAKRGDSEFVCVTLNAPDDWNDHKNLLQNAFSQYETVRAVSSGDKAGLVKKCENESAMCAVAENEIRVLKNKDENLEVKYNIFETTSDNIKRGDVVGECSVFLNGKCAGKTNLVSWGDMQEAQEYKFKDAVSDVLKRVVF